MGLASTSLDSTSAFLGGVAVFQTVAAVVNTQHGGKVVLTRANAIGAMVCTIATSVYHRMRTATNDEMHDLRHADWVVTCPLMLWEIYTLLGINIREYMMSFTFSVVAIVACILLGRVSLERKGSQRVTLFSLATLVFVAMLTNILFVVPHWNDEVVVPLCFLGTWVLYPLAFWDRSGTAYNVLDLVSKGVFGLYVAARVL